MEDPDAAEGLDQALIDHFPLKHCCCYNKLSRDNYYCAALSGSGSGYLVGAKAQDESETCLYV